VVFVFVQVPSQNPLLAAHDEPQPVCVVPQEA
jgi:hypothetical protein